MRNLAEKWTVVPDWAEATIEAPGLKASAVIGLNQYLVSGNLDAWSAVSGLPAKGIGALGEARGDAYAVQVARDRLLVVSATASGIEAGWHADGFAVTPVNAGHHLFEVEGPAQMELVARATTLDPAAPSASAALSFAGANAVVYRHGGKLRIHVDRALATYLWTWMQTAAANIAA